MSFVLFGVIFYKHYKLPLPLSSIQFHTTTEKNIFLNNFHCLYVPLYQMIDEWNLSIIHFHTRIEKLYFIIIFINTCLSCKCILNNWPWLETACDWWMEFILYSFPHQNRKIIPHNNFHLYLYVHFMQLKNWP